MKRIEVTFYQNGYATILTEQNETIQIRRTKAVQALIWMHRQNVSYIWIKDPETGIEQAVWEQG